MPKSLTFKTDEILFNDNLGNGSCTIRDSSGTLDICGNLDISGTVGIYRNLDISGSTNIYGNLDVSGSTRLGKSGTPVVTLDISATDAIRIPVGTTGERPTTQQAGQIRYNTTTSQFEGYNQSSSWQGLGGVIDIDQDTYIIAETNPLDDNDEIQIYTEGVERLKIDASGSTDIYGNLGVSGSLDISGSTNIYGNLDVSGSTRLGKSGIPVVTLDISATDAIRIPVGTTGERPTTQQAGQIRYNTTTSQFEGYNQSSSWQGLGGVIDIDQDTYIIAETNPLDDNDEIQIYTAGVERLKIHATGTTDIYGNLDVSGSLDISGSTNIYGNLDVSGSTRLGKSGTPVVTLDISATDAIRIPVGTTGERPTITEAGQIRYNTTTSQFEGYNQSSSWQGLGGVIDIDQDTKIIAETNPLDDNDEIQIYTAGVERLKIHATGTTDIYGNLDVSGDISCVDISAVFIDASNGNIKGKLIVGNLSLEDTGSHDWPAFKHKDITNSNSFALQQNNNGSTILNCAANEQIDFRVDNVDKLTINSSGYLGIGTTNPQRNLHVAGDISCVDISAQNIDASNGNIKGKLIVGNLSLEDTGSHDWPAFKHKDITNSNSFALQQNNNGSTILNCAVNEQIDFRVDNVDKLTINSNGYLGIGTTNPQRNLHVAGDISCVDISAQNIDVNNTIYTSGLVIKNIGLLGAVYNHGNQTIGGVKTFSDNVIIGGSLIVTGTMTTISTAHTIVNDPLMELGNGRSGTSHGDGGLIIERGDLSNVFLGWDESIAKFHLGTTEATGLSTGNINITTGTLVADISATDISCARLNVTGRATPNRKGGLSVTSDMSGGVGYDPTELGVHMGQFNNKPRLWLTTASTSSNGQIFFGTALGGSPGRITYYHSGTAANADAMTFSTDSSERVRIDGTGNVGIGTSSPQSALHVQGTNVSGTYFTGSGATGGSPSFFRELTISTSAATLDSNVPNSKHTFKINSSFGEFLFKNNGESPDLLFLRSDGNVGIGTSNPSKKLEVDGDVKVDGDFYLTNNVYLRYITAIATPCSLRLGRLDESTRYHEIKSYLTNTSSTSYLTFSVHNGGSSTTDVLTIKSASSTSGNVGIGTSSPSALLTLSTSGGPTLMRFERSSENAHDIDIGNRSGRFVVDGGGNASGATSTSHVSLTERFCVLSDGNVGIGTTEPGAQLSIKGPHHGDSGGTEHTYFAAGMRVSATASTQGIWGALAIGWARASSNYHAAKHIFQTCGSNSEIQFRQGSNTDYNNMYSSQTFKEWLYLKYDGNVGIGTTNPERKLHVATGSGVTIENTVDNWPGPCFIKHNVGNPHGAAYRASLFIHGDHGRSHPLIQCNTGTNNSPATSSVFKVSYNGNVFSNTNNYTSDDRLKHNESDIENSLDIINKLKPQKYIKTYDVKDSCGNEYSSNHNFTANDLSNGLPEDTYYDSGYIAQDVSNIAELNHLVSGSEYDESGNPTPLALNYTGIQPYLTKAVQELHALVLQQSQLISQQGQQILDLSAQVAALS